MFPVTMYYNIQDSKTNNSLNQVDGLGLLDSALHHRLF